MVQKLNSDVTRERKKSSVIKMLTRGIKIWYPEIVIKVCHLSKDEGLKKSKHFEYSKDKLYTDTSTQT